MNAMGNSSKGSSKRDMTFCDSKINLEMIHKVWKGNVLGINTLWIYEKVTDGHFDKNTHSRMIVYLAVKVLSKHVHKILSKYHEDNIE